MLQVANVVFFEDDKGQLARWDDQIMGVCNTVNEIVDNIHALRKEALAT
jgi:hypothetical protein